MCVLYLPSTPSRTHIVLPVDQRICDVVSLRQLEVRRLHWDFCALLMAFARPTSYGSAQVGVAVSKTPCGPYTYLSSWRPFGAESRDMGIFQDGNSYS